MRKMKLLALSLVFGLVVLAPLLPAQVKAADGTTGSFKYDFGQLINGQSIYVVVKDLTAEADYKINMTGDSNGISFTTGAGQTTYGWQTTVTRGSTDTFYIYLRYQSAGTVIDTIATTCIETDTATNVDFFMDLALPLLLLAIIAMVVVGIVKGRK